MAQRKLHKKGDSAECGNYRGISLLSIIGKVFTHIVLNRLVSTIDIKLSEMQGGFRKKRGCADQIFIMRRLMEMTRRKNVPVFMCFVYLKAAYDTVNREALLKVLGFYGLSQKVRNLIKALYSGTEAAVRVDGDLTDWFGVLTGLRQGCLLLPALFNVYIEALAVFV